MQLRASCARIMRLSTRALKTQPGRGSRNRKLPEKQSAWLLAHPYAVTRPSREGVSPGRVKGIRVELAHPAPELRPPTKKSGVQGLQPLAGVRGRSPPRRVLFFCFRFVLSGSWTDNRQRVHRGFLVVFVLLLPKIFAS